MRIEIHVTKLDLINYSFLCSASQLSLRAYRIVTGNYETEMQIMQNSLF